MAIGMWFWLFMVLWLFLGGYCGRADFQAGRYGWFGSNLLLFVLLALLGWKVFGPPLQ